MLCLPKGIVVFLVGSVLREFELRNDDAYMTTFMLLGMLRGNGFTKRYFSLRNQIKLQFTALHESVSGP